MTGDEQALVNAVVAALSAGKLDEPWPEHLQLRDALDELTRWLGADHQWGASRSAPHWRSLIHDVADALGDLGPSGQRTLDSRTAVIELERYAAEFESKSQVKDDGLRTHLSRCAQALAGRTDQPDVLMAGWEDLLVSARGGGLTSAGDAARHLLSLATALGHDVDSFVRCITQALDGERAMRIDGELVSPETDVPLDERLSAARAAVAIEPARAHLTVWLRFRLAQIRWPPVIPIGEEVRIYRGDWLRSCLCAPAPHHDLPAEATGEDAALRPHTGKPAGRHMIRTKSQPPTYESWLANNS
jgi:hypothetical protein